MQQPKIILFALGLLLSIPLNLAAQSSFNTCAAAFLDGKMLVASYTPDAQAILPDESVGMLTVNEIQLDENGVKAEARIPFQVGIKNAETNTLTLWSEKNWLGLDVRKVLPQCKKGDKIVLLTKGDQWALPHHEILVK